MCIVVTTHAAIIISLSCVLIIITNRIYTYIPIRFLPTVRISCIYNSSAVTVVHIVLGLFSFFDISVARCSDNTHIHPYRCTISFFFEKEQISSSTKYVWVYERRAFVNESTKHKLHSKSYMSQWKTHGTINDSEKKIRSVVFLIVKFYVWIKFWWK